MLTYKYLEVTVLLVVIFLTFVGLTIFFAVTEKKNKTLSSMKITGRDSRVYTIKIDYAKQKIFFYKKENAIEIIEYRIQEFMNMLDLDQQKKWTEWTSGLIRNDSRYTVFLPLVLGIHGLNGETDPLSDLIWLKLVFKSKSSSIIYLTGNVIDASVMNKIVRADSLVMIDWDELKELIYDKANSNSLVNDRGALVAVSCNMYDVISKRYDEEVANQYLNEVWEIIHGYNSPERVAGRYEKDTFLIYLPNCISKRSTEKFISELKESLNITLSFDIYQFDLIPHIGVSFMGHFNKEVEKVAEEAKRALKENKKDDKIIYYNDKMEAERSEIVSRYDQLNKMINDMDFNPLFYPVFSLHTGDVVGYFSEVDFSKYLLNNFTSAYQYAVKAEIDRKFFSAISKAWLEEFLKLETRTNNKIFIFCDLRQLETLEEVILSDRKYSEIEVCAIITSYIDLLNAGEYAKEILYRAKDCHITLGIVADEEMQTHLLTHLHQFTWLVLPSKMTKNVNVDKRVQFEISGIIDSLENYHLNLVAWNIDNYSQAEILKSLGIMFMHGPILDNRENDYSSVRRIAKLIDERE